MIRMNRNKCLHRGRLDYGCMAKMPMGPKG